MRLAGYRRLTKNHVKHEIELLMAEDGITHTRETYQIYYTKLKICIPLSNQCSEKWQNFYEKACAIVALFFPGDNAVEELRTQKNISDSLMFLLARMIPGSATNVQQKPLDIHEKDDLHALKVLIDSFVKLGTHRMELINHVHVLERYHATPSPGNEKALLSETPEGDDALVARLNHILGDPD